MAIKRRVAESDSEVGPSQASTSKRARTIEEDSDVEVEASGSGTKLQGKQKASEAMSVEVDEDEEDVQQVAPDADEEKRFEQEHEDAIRERVFGGHKGPGVSNCFHLLESFIFSRDADAELDDRILQKWESLRNWRCITSCVTNAWCSALVLR